MTEKDKEINELRREVESLRKDLYDGVKRANEAIRKAYIDGYLKAINSLGEALKAEAERVENEISQPEDKDA